MALAPASPSPASCPSWSAGTPPPSLEEVNQRLGEIRDVFSAANVNQGVQYGLVVASGVIEQTLPPKLIGRDIRGFQDNVVAELDSMEEMIAEIECEYGESMRVGLWPRVFGRLAMVAKKTSDRNASMAGV